MSNSLKLIEVSRDNGWKNRIRYHLVGKARQVLGEVTPASAEAALARVLIYPSSADAAGVADRFGIMMLTETVVASALADNNFDHNVFTDAQFVAQVSALWPIYAKSVPQ